LNTNALVKAVADYLVGSHVLPCRLTGNHCRNFPLHDVPKVREVVPLTVRSRMWSMHDGAPALFIRAVRNVLSNTYHDDEEDPLHGLHTRQI
jgi:hypothetical protein